MEQIVQPQPTIERYALTKREKGEEAERPTNRNDGIITFCSIYAKYITSMSPKSAKFFGLR